MAQSMASITSRGFAGAVGVEHLQVDQVRGRRHARIRALSRVVEAARRDDAGDVRAVAVEVVALARAGSVKSTLAMTRFCSAGWSGDAAVDDRHADAAAVDLAQRRDRAGPRRVGAGHVAWSAPCASAPRALPDSASTSGVLRQRVERLLRHA